MGRAGREDLQRILDELGVGHISQAIESLVFKRALTSVDGYLEMHSVDSEATYNKYVDRREKEELHKLWAEHHRDKMRRAWERIRRGKTLAEKFFGVKRDPVGELLESSAALSHHATILWRMTKNERWAREGVEALSTLASVLEASHRYQALAETYEKIVDLATSIGDREKAAKTLLLLGSTYSIMGHLNGAIKRFEDALAISRELNNKLLIAGILISMGFAYKSLNSEEYKRCGEEALRIAEELSIKSLAEAAKKLLEDC